MFDQKYEDRLATWRNFRNGLEAAPSPLEDVVAFYKSAPYVSILTDPWDKSTWLGPWELLHENQYCDFSRVLGMCYSLQLTERFKDLTFEIHIGMDHSNAHTYYLLYVNNYVIGYKEDCVVERTALPDTLVSQRIYVMPTLH
jgi:hypothetical protein